MFQISNPKDCFPYTAFDIDLPSKTLAENANVIINQYPSPSLPSLKRDLDYYVNLIKHNNDTTSDDNVGKDVEGI